jgi:hypothetical protein
MPDKALACPIVLISDAHYGPCCSVESHQGDMLGMIHCCTS